MVLLQDENSAFVAAAESKVLVDKNVVEKASGFVGQKPERNRIGESFRRIQDCARKRILLEQEIGICKAYVQLRTPRVAFNFSL